MGKQYCISDIHGCVRTLTFALDNIAFSTSDELFLLGDYVDRGPSSKQVIDTIWKLQSQGYNITCLKGNHEEIVCEAYDTSQRREHYSRPGLESTLESFSVDYPHDIPEPYIQFMRDLPLYKEVGSFILVHAGLNIKSQDPLSTADNTMVWVRNWYPHIDYNWLGDRYIIHGHTPQFKNEIERMHRYLPEKRVLDIDNGCFFHEGEFGSLCVYNMTDNLISFHSNQD